MLVLTRKAGQVIKIGDDVEVVVLEVRGEQVRLGIRAPRNVSVFRGEIVEDIREPNLEASATVANAMEILAGLTAPGPSGTDSPDVSPDSDENRP